MASQYERLRIARDLAAYRALGHIDAAICYCRQGDSKMALSILTSARSLYQAAAKALDNHTTSNYRKQNSARPESAGRPAGGD